MALLWEPLIEWVKQNPDLAITYVLVIAVTIWIVNYFLYSVCKQVVCKPMDWRVDRVVARIVWSQDQLTYFKVFVGCIAATAIVGWYWREYLLHAILATIAIGAFIFYKEFLLLKSFWRGSREKKQYRFLCYIRGLGFKYVSLNSRKVRGLTPIGLGILHKGIVFGEKCIYYDGETNDYFLDNDMPPTHKMDVDRMEDMTRDLLKVTDSFVAQGARASPGVVQHDLLQNAIPLPEGEYHEYSPQKDTSPGPIRDKEVTGRKEAQKREYEKKDEEPEEEEHRVRRRG